MKKKCSLFLSFVLLVCGLTACGNPGGKGTHPSNMDVVANSGEENQSEGISVEG